MRHLTLACAVLLASIFFSMYAHSQETLAGPARPEAARQAFPTVPPAPTAPPSPTADPQFVQPTATPLPTTPPLPTATPLPPTATPLPLLEGVPAPVLAGDLVMRTYSIDFYRLPGGLNEQAIKQLAMPTERAIAIVGRNLGRDVRLEGRVSIRFEPAQTGICAIRGWTISQERTIRMFYEPDFNPETIIPILAHELFHQLQHDYYGQGPHLRSDNVLLEGMATWGSSDYFVDPDGSPRYRRHVREALAGGYLLPLATDLDVDCRTSTRGNIYSQWASFVEYLIDTYGKEKLNAVYVDSTGRKPGSANYVGVYGKTLAELEADWIAWARATQ